MIERRKVSVSIRMPTADVRKVKKLAQRLGARESEVIRFAVKLMLGKLGPLCDPEVAGRGLVPVFVESGTELLRFFDLDAARLESIINGAVEEDRKVEHDDIALIALTCAQQPYAALRLSELNREERSAADAQELGRSLREYLYDKYVYRGAADDARLPETAVFNMLGAAVNE